MRPANSMICAAICVSIASTAMACEPGGQHLFSRVDLKNTELSRGQAKMLDRISRKKSSLAIEVVRFEKGGMSDTAGPLIIPLPKDQTVQLPEFKLAKSDENVQQLTSDAKVEGVSASLTLVGDSVTGLLYVGEQVYAVEPLGGGLQAIVTLDQTRFPPDEPPAAQRKLEEPRK